MTNLDKHIGYLFAAELQFRLASAVRLAVTGQNQPLDLPMEWSHGRHSVSYEEIALRQDQADYAASLIHLSAIYTMAVAIKDSIEAIAPGLSNAVKKSGKDIEKVVQAINQKPWKTSDGNVVTAYHIARLIRNAYAHAPFDPHWDIRSELRSKEFQIPDVVTLDTTSLHGIPFDWRHYGGPLAMFRFCRFVRTQILGDDPAPRKMVPIPSKKIYQQGNLILTAVDKIQEDAVREKIPPRPDGGIPLVDGHVLYPGAGDKSTPDDESGT